MESQTAVVVYVCSVRFGRHEYRGADVPSLTYIVVPLAKAIGIRRRQEQFNVTSEITLRGSCHPHRTPLS